MAADYSTRLPDESIIHCRDVTALPIQCNSTELPRTVSRESIPLHQVTVTRCSCSAANAPTSAINITQADPRSNVTSQRNLISFSSSNSIESRITNGAPTSTETAQTKHQPISEAKPFEPGRPWASLFTDRTMPCRPISQVRDCLPHNECIDPTLTPARPSTGITVERPPSGQDYSPVECAAVHLISALHD